MGMGIGQDDFRVRGGTAADRAYLDASLRYLSQSPVGAAIMQKTADQGTEIRIVHDGRDQYDPQTNTIYWDPHAAHAVQDQHGKPAALQSSAMGLLHEGAHALDPDIKEGLATRNKQFGNDAEAHAIGAENAVAADLGEPQRYSHFGVAHRADDPTAHTPVNAPAAGDPSSDLDALITYLLRMFLKC